MRQIPLSIFGRNAKVPAKEETTPVTKVVEKEPVIPEPVVEPDPEPVPTVKPTPEPITELPAEPITEDKETVPEEVTSEVTEEAPPEEKPKEEPAEEPKEEPVKKPEEVKEPEPEQAEIEEPKKKRTAKKTVEKAAEATASMKMTGATKLMDAVSLVVPEYEDPSYAEFMEHMEQALLRTVFDERADAGVIKVILSNLARCYDNATRKYADVSAKLETVANKNYGLIIRQTAANSIGSNEAERKRNGLHAPEVYKGAGGKTVNLFAIEAGLRKQALELQTIIKQIEFKKSAIIAYLTASKQDADV